MKRPTFKWCILTLLDIFSRFVMTLFILAVIISAIVTAGFRHYLPHVDNYREQILEQLNKNPSGMIVSAERIDNDWRPFRPSLAFNNVSIQHSNWDKALELNALVLELDTLRTVFSGSLRFSSIELDSLNILLTESESGRWTLAGFVSQGGEPLDAQVLLTKIWDIGRIKLNDVSIRMRRFGEQDITLPSLHVDMYSSGNSKRIVASLSAQKNKISRINIETEGEPFTEEFSALAYWKLDDYQVAEFWQLLNLPLVMDSAMLGGEFWLNWSADEVDLRGKVNLDNMLLHRVDENKPANSKPIEIDHLSSEFAADFKAGYAQLWSPEIRVQHADADISLKNIAMQKDADTHVQLSSVDIAAVMTFAQYLPLPEKLQQVLADLSPAGELKNVHVDIQKRAEQALDFSLSAQLAAVSANAWKGAPAIKNVNGLLTASKLSGQVSLFTEDLSLAFPKLYDDQMQFDTAEGIVSWWLDTDDIYVKGQQLSLRGDYGDADGEFYLQIPKDKMQGDVGRLILDIGIKNSDAKYKNSFIPKILPKPLLTWLDDNIHAGKVKQAGFIFHGPISHPAIEVDAIEEKKVVQLWLDVEQGRVSYLPQWPIVENATAHVLLDDKEVFAKVSAAKMGDLHIKDADVAVESVAQGQRVNVQAYASGKTSSVMNLLQLPVLSQPLGFMQQWTSPNGHVFADVSISTVVQDAKDSLSLNVRSTISKAALVINDYNLVIRDINGPLDFNLNSGLSSKGLQAIFWQQPVKAVISSKPSAKGPLSKVKFSSKVSTKSLTDWTKQPVFSLMEGVTDVDGAFYFGAEGAGLQLESDLRGIIIDLPKPFAKTTDKERKFTLHMPFTGEEKELTANFGAGVDIRFLMGPEGFSAGQINLGLNKSEYQKNKIIVGGQIAEADAEQWLNTFQNYQQAAEALGQSLEQTFSRNEEDGPAWTAAIEKLHIRQLNAYGHSLQNVKYDLYDASAFWQMGLEHPQLSGTLSIARDASPMRLYLQYIDLDLLAKKLVPDVEVDKEALGDAEGKAFISPLANPELANFPAMDVVVDSVWWKKQDYGEWQFELRSNKNAVLLDNLQASVKHMRLGPDEKNKASLSWSLGENSRTQFHGRFTADNLADALSAWGYSQEITSRSAQFDVDAAWRGVVTDYDFSEVVGNAKLQWREGTFADVGSSQTGALKVVGFFNVSLLVKRLQLDFSDLSSKGLAYDSVDGQIYFDEGVLTLKDELIINAPSSKIQMKGWADLNTEKVDMAMGVSLPLATNLPWVVALAAGLPAAAGVFIVSKLLKKQVSTLFSAVYKIDGDLNDPNVEFVRLFDTGLPDLSQTDKPVNDLSQDEKAEIKAQLERLKNNHLKALEANESAGVKTGAAESAAPKEL